MVKIDPLCPNILVGKLGRRQSAVGYRFVSPLHTVPIFLDNGGSDARSLYMSPPDRSVRC